MKRFVGDFARTKLSSLIQRIDIYRAKPSEEELNHIKSEIEIYGDEYLRLKLKNALKL